MAAQPRLHAPLLGLEQARLGGSHPSGGRCVFDLLEQRIELAVELEAPGDALAQRERRGGLLVWAQHLEQGARFTQRPLALGRAFERAVRFDETLTFGGREAQRVDRPMHAHLLGFAKPGEGVGESERDPACVAFARHLGCEIASEGEALADPGLSPPHKACALAGAQSVLLGEEIDHTRLVHGRERLLGRIAAKQERGTLKRSFARRGGGLEEHGDGALAGLAQCGEALESIDHLEAPRLARIG